MLACTTILWLFVLLCCVFGFSRQCFSVALEPVLELALVDQAGLELTVILLPLPLEGWTYTCIWVPASTPLRKTVRSPVPADESQIPSLGLSALTFSSLTTIPGHFSEHLS